LISYPTAELLILRPFRWHVAVPEAFLVSDEVSEHLLPRGCQWVPLESEGGEALDTFGGQASKFVEPTLSMRPNGELNILRRSPWYIAAARLFFECEEAGEHLLPSFREWIPREAESFQTTQAFRS